MDQFRGCLNNELHTKYDYYLSVAKRISRKKDVAPDLLHTVIEAVYNSGRAPSICDRGEIEAYIVRMIQIQWIDRDSQFWKQQPSNHDELPYYITDQTDQSGRIFNENADSVISRLPLIEAELMRLYTLTDFDYNEVSLATGVPITYLYGRIAKAKKKLRNYVDSSKT